MGSVGSVLTWIGQFLGYNELQLSILALLIAAVGIVVGLVTFIRRTNRFLREQQLAREEHEKLLRAQELNKNWRKISLQIHCHSPLPNGDKMLGIRNVLTAADTSAIFTKQGAAELLEKMAEAHDSLNSLSPYPDADISEFLKDLAGWFGTLLPKDAGIHMCTLFIEKGPKAERFILRGVACPISQLMEYDDPRMIFTTEPGRAHQEDRITASQHFAAAVLHHSDPVSGVGMYNGRKVTEIVDPSITGK